jgi:hypothetical protein
MRDRFRTWSSAREVVPSQRFSNCSKFRNFWNRGSCRTHYTHSETSEVDSMLEFSKSGGGCGGRGTHTGRFPEFRNRRTSEVGGGFGKRSWGQARGEASRIQSRSRLLKQVVQPERSLHRCLRAIFRVGRRSRPAAALDFELAAASLRNGLLLDVLPCGVVLG